MVAPAHRHLPRWGTQRPPARSRRAPSPRRSPGLPARQRTSRYTSAPTGRPRRPPPVYGQASRRSCRWSTHWLPNFTATPRPTWRRSVTAFTETVACVRVRGCSLRSLPEALKALDPPGCAAERQPSHGDRRAAGGVGCELHGRGRVLEARGQDAGGAAAAAAAAGRCCRRRRCCCHRGRPDQISQCVSSTPARTGRLLCQRFPPKPQAATLLENLSLARQLGAAQTHFAQFGPRLDALSARLDHIQHSQAAVVAAGAGLAVAAAAGPPGPGSVGELLLLAPARLEALVGLRAAVRFYPPTPGIRSANPPPSTPSRTGTRPRGSALLAAKRRPPPTSSHLITTYSPWPPPT